MKRLYGKRDENEVCMMDAYRPRENPHSDVASAFKEFYLLTNKLALLMEKGRSY